MPRNFLNEEQVDIAIIGAGLAGLEAAHCLMESDKKFLILESTNSIGGRAKSFSMNSGVAMNRGAEWIHGHIANPIFDKLVLQHNAKTFPADFYSEDVAMKYFVNGKALSEKMCVLFNRLYSELVEKLYRQKITADQSLLKSCNSIIDRMNFPTNELKVNFTQIAYSRLSGFHAQSIEKVTTLGTNNYEQCAGEQLVLSGTTYQELMMTRYKDVLPHIYFNHRVKEINHISDQNFIEVISGDKKIITKLVIVAVPLGILKANQICFRPQLPNKIQKAIKRLGFGLLSKVFIRFSECFWDNDKIFLTYLHAGQVHNLVNMRPFTGVPILVAFYGGNDAYRVEADPKSSINFLQSTLAAVYGDASLTLEETICSNWSKDPNALGSYTYVEVGQSDTDCAELAKAIRIGSNSIIFAGEHTSANHYSSMHGAMESGVRAAQQCIRHTS